MADSSDGDDSPAGAEEDSPASAAFLEFLHAGERGERVDVERFLDRHRACAEELRELFRTIDDLDHERAGAEADDPRLAQPLQGRYRIERFLGRGGMGRVQLATDLRTGAAVAIKLLARGNDARLHERFRREASLGAALGQRLRGTARILDFHALEDGTPYLVMEYVEGPSLRQRIAVGPLPPDEGARIIERLCATLAAVHASGVAHGDVKPSNVVLHQPECPGAPPEPVLIDFGVARARGPLQVGPDTTSHEFRGTLRYAAPESLDGQIDPRSDQFSLGVMAYEVMTGHHPFDVDGLGALIDRIRTRVPPRADEANPAVPRAAAAAIARAMAKRPEDRFPGVAEFGAALVQPREPGGRPARGARVLLAALAASAITGAPIDARIGGAGVTALAAISAARGRPVAAPPAPATLTEAPIRSSPRRVSTSRAASALLRPAPPRAPSALVVAPVDAVAARGGSHGPLGPGIGF